jgi:hypothetical protein
MLLTQRQAISKLRTATGHSIAWCETKVKSLPKTPDGKREKVSKWHVDKAIREANEPPQMNDTGIRPISAKKAAKVRELCF